jgi:hypothetical protein
MSILAFLLCFFLAAFAASALFDFAHASIGAPHIAQTGEAQYQNGFIFSAFGAWVATKYNKAEEGNYKKLTQIAANYDFTDGDKLYAKAVLSGENDVMPTDAEVLAYLSSEQLARLQEEDNFVNWYKPLGVCWYCTMFWFCTFLGAALLFAYSAYYPVSGGVWALSLLHFAPICIKMREIING